MAVIWGGFTKESTNNYHDMLYSIKENTVKYYWLYDNCRDITSQKTLLNICRYRISVMESFLKNISCDNTAFFDEELVQFNKDTVLVDIDDSIVSHENKCKKYINMYKLNKFTDDKVTLIKINCRDDLINRLNDIENLIKRDLPSIAVCVDNNFTDLWAVPQKIYEINTNYKFYIRYYINDNAGKTVLYAIMN